MTTDYRIVYTKRRTLGITVERDGAVIVRAPNGMDESEVRQLVSSKSRWIAEKVAHPQKYHRSTPPGKELVSGESMLYLGRNYRVEIVDSSPTSGIEFDQKFLVPRCVSERGRVEFRAWYEDAARSKLVPRVEHWAEKLGVQPSHIKVTDVKYRWGSCTPAGNVNLNWRLIKAPVSVGDYVIVHELAHLLQTNHDDRFWSIVRSQVSKVESSRAWLREHGHLLEQDL
jgi:predicted metal-dependent hydrolase